MAVHSSKAVEQLLEVDNGESLIQITQWINQLYKSSWDLSICKALFVQTVFIVKLMDRKLKTLTQKPKIFCCFKNILEPHPPIWRIIRAVFSFLQIYINKSWSKEDIFTRFNTRDRTLFVVFIPLSLTHHEYLFSFITKQFNKLFGDAKSFLLMHIWWFRFDVVKICICYV